MKINQTTKITGDKVILVPYRKHHVLKYHDWMSLPEIKKLTASEPLTIEEEYQMQSNWQLDEDKLTFIVLRRDLYESFKSDEDNTGKEIFSMIGDVNVFISEEDDDERDRFKKSAELEIMIPDVSNRGHGYGTESVNLMIDYCVKNIDNISDFIVKINEENVASIKMFEKLGFIKYKYVKVFQEQCLKLKVNEDMKLNLGEKRDDNFLRKYDLNYV